MRKKFITLLLSLSTISAYAQNDLTVSDLAKNTDTKAAFQKMIGKQKLPEWVMQNGTSSPTKYVEINGKKYWVLNSCKPHDCGSQSIAVLYSPGSKTLSGVFSTNNEREISQQLLWLNITDDLSIDGRTILFAALTGSLDNHPDSFNFK